MDKALVTGQGGYPFEVLVVLGPTASGKSVLAEKLASVLSGEIVSADSMQVYRYMDIGTAKIPLSERSVPYHCLDVVDPGEPFSVALYQSLARAAIDDIIARGKLPIVCGGTGLYIQAALDCMEFPTGDQECNPVRDHYMALADEIGAEGLHELLAEKDPESALLIHPHNVRRVVRAFEMLEENTTYAMQHEGLSQLEPYYKSYYLGLHVATDILNARIDERVDAMMRNGLLEEVESLLEAGFREGITAPQAIGYKEFVPLLLDRDLLDAPDEIKKAVEKVKQSSRRYGKRQRTWFRREKRIVWVDADEGITERLFKEVLEMLTKAS